MTQRRRRETPHAEGQHGSETHKRLVEQLQSGPSQEPTADMLESDHRRAALEGKRRLVEDREQHDEAEKNSERNRLFEDTERGHADEGPSDNSGNLHGVLRTSDHRADNQERDRKE